MTQDSNISKNFYMFSCSVQVIFSLLYFFEYKSSFFAGEAIHILAYQLIFESLIIFMFSASVQASGNRSRFYINKVVSVTISLSICSRLCQLV